MRKNIIFLILLCAAAVALRSAAAEELAVNEAAAPPEIDGVGDDECWSLLPAAEISVDSSAGPIKVSLKALKSDGSFYLLAVFPAATEKREHRPWIWSPVEQIYVAGEETEETLSIFIFSGAEDGTADLWIWRAARNNPSGFADDFSLLRQEALSPNKEFKILPDSGDLPWQSRFFADFAGDKIPRFYSRTPTGSAGDVRARGAYKDGAWTVEFARKLDTGNSDDLPLSPGSKVVILPVLGPPQPQYEPSATVVPTRIGQ